MIVKRRYKFTAICDGCGTELAPEYDYLDAVSAMKQQGWLIARQNCMSPEWYHFCPVCRERNEKKWQSILTGKRC
jgi:hypothetical protein